jgi:hypothetical protein
VTGEDPAEHQLARSGPKRRGEAHGRRDGGDPVEPVTTQTTTGRNEKSVNGRNNSDARASHTRTNEPAVVVAADSQPEAMVPKKSKMPMAASRLAALTCNAEMRQYRNQVNGSGRCWRRR